MTEKKPQTKQLFLVGVDVGSTTTKIAVVDTENREIVYSDYRRHNAAQFQSVHDALLRMKELFTDAQVHLAFTGSGSKGIAEYLGVPYIQEVVANSIALRERYHNVRTAIELGGQDAKMIFFRKEEDTGALNVADMRMNGSCAGGTGAFIDEVAAILKVPIEEFDALAAKGTCVYDISGRCGVYAKTDIQPLLNQGISRQDLALSACHAIAKQTIGGLAQGLDIEKPVVFEGGPLTFNPTLVKVFAERLELSPEEAMLPKHPEIMMAYGAALSLESMFDWNQSAVCLEKTIDELRADHMQETVQENRKGKLYFASVSECEQFREKHRLPSCDFREPVPGQTIHAYLGIDSGSTTTKFVLMDQEENILDSFYC